MIRIPPLLASSLSSRNIQLSKLILQPNPVLKLSFRGISTLSQRTDFTSHYWDLHKPRLKPLLVCNALNNSTNLKISISKPSWNRLFSTSSTVHHVPFQDETDEEYEVKAALKRGDQFVYVYAVFAGVVFFSMEYIHNNLTSIEGLNHHKIYDEAWELVQKHPRVQQLVGGEMEKIGPLHVIPERTQDGQYMLRLKVNFKGANQQAQMKVEALQTQRFPYKRWEYKYILVDVHNSRAKTIHVLDNRTDEQLQKLMRKGIF